MDNIILKITGKNINRIIERISNHNINIYNIKYIDDGVIIEVSCKDYDSIIKLKTIYDIRIIRYKGISNIKLIIKKNRYLLISLIIGIFIFSLLLNIIFDVEVIYSGSKLRDYVYSELDKYGIKKYRFTKSYDEIDKIKKKILEDSKDKLEWIEIEREGTKYIVRLEPRKISNNEEDTKIYNIVSNRSAIIKSIEASSGEIVRKINTYVEKGDIIISSDITLNDEVKKIVSARGRVYGEVWYKVNISYPLKYYEEKETGRSKEVYNLRIINNDYNLSDFKNKRKEDRIIFKSDLLPIYFSKQKQYELDIIDYEMNGNEAKNKALEDSRERIKSSLNDKEYIISEKCLKITNKDSKIELDIFYTVYKDITEYVEIEG